jgi:hypothetical protein
MGVELSVRAEALVARAALLVAERDQLAEADALRTQARLATERVKSVASGGMSMLATRHAIDARHVEFLWAAAVLASDPRLVLHAEALAGPTVRRGLSVALHARLVGLDDDSARQLAIELSTTSKLVANGLLIPDESASAVTRTYLAPPRLLGFLRGIEAPEPGLRFVSPVEVLVLDDAQQAVIAEMRTVLAGNAVLLLEGPPSSGRISAIARAAGRQLVVLESLTKERILALRRELMLSDALPVIADVDRMPEENRGALEALIATAERIVLTATTATYIRCERPTVRMRWRIADTATLRRQWEHLASGPVSGVDDLATRFRVGPGAMVRAIESARIWTSTLDAATLAAGLRHNISEELGGLAERVEVTQSWDDLVLAPDTLGQVHTLIARVRHKYQVLESWGYRSKIARGTGVPALFSGPPGTGKTMVAGLIARELGLDLYQVDLSQIVSKWVGETEKQLARVFDAAEQGHGLLLFDEADALFGQRSQDVKGAVDRYANLEVNYLLQRVESFGGITILTTNLDQSIDRALKRRLAAHIVFDLPDDEEREQLWRRLVTTGSAPLDTKIDIVELAEQFPRMSGANIRNATLAAAFLAASHGDRLITQETLLRAARAEYRSMGHVLTERR